MFMMLTIVLDKDLECVGDNGRSGSHFPRAQQKLKVLPRDTCNTLKLINKPFIGRLSIVTLLASRRLAPTSFTGKPALQKYLCDPQWFRDTASRGPTTIVTSKSQFRTCPTDHGKAPSNIAPCSPRSTTIGESRVAKDAIAMNTSWRSNSDIASVTRQTHLPKTHPVLWPEIYHTIVYSDNIGYPRMKASGESSTTKHRLLHASGPHPIPPPNDPKGAGKRVKVRRLSYRVSMMFRVVRTNQYNQDLGLIHSTNGNHLESPNEGSSIDHQVTIHLHAENITMFPTNETWYFTS
ncbi:hypothetical protein F511_15146 [Dorcoceras hygrometricum]|uniref:Uncharacterized protein n=1 Tax=Dorcoceras hygrometricum TaxID=472368 RepID=A0A2Z7B5I3_9LAMI|nr:hypothetical protein F511_15146 [Dorcoceras hygrometricum]